jgi:hypothetical protein
MRVWGLIWLAACVAHPKPAPAPVDDSEREEVVPPGPSGALGTTGVGSASGPADDPSPDPPPPPAPSGPALDAFGVRMLWPTKPGGHVWAAKWSSSPRTLLSGDTDPLDPEFHNRGSATTFTIAGDGTATASGDVMRHYIWDKTGQQAWGDIELTFYALRVSESAVVSTAGLVAEVRTDDGHTSDPVRSCIGNAYAMALYYDGRATFKKELKHPNYSAVNPSTQLWASVPLGVWVGFKAIVRDEGAAVLLELYRDLSDGAGGGDWQRVLSAKDSGGWQVGSGADICGFAADRILSGAFPIVIIRDDQATIRYKKASLREISAGP